MPDKLFSGIIRMNFYACNSKTLVQFVLPKTFCLRLRQKKIVERCFNILKVNFLLQKLSRKSHIIYFYSTCPAAYVTSGLRQHNDRTLLLELQDNCEREKKYCKLKFIHSALRFCNGNLQAIETHGAAHIRCPC